jgi:tol-pal system protein YbgF
MLLFFLFTGCASTGDLDAMRSEINQLKRDSFELRKENAEIRKEASELKRQSTGAVKEDSFNAIRESQASLYSQVAEQSKEIQVLRGRFDEYRFFMDRETKENTAEREVVRSRINTLEERLKELSDRFAKADEGKQPAPEQRPAGGDGGEKASEQKKIEENASAIYEAAYNTFKERKFRDAREKFSAFIKKFPKDGLVGNAHFWTGESYFAEKDFESAILAYETVIKSYPQSLKVPGALYKQGLSFMELGDKKTAKVIFEKLIEKYPDSPEAASAKKKKAEMDKKPAIKGAR